MSARRAQTPTAPALPRERRGAASRTAPPLLPQTVTRRFCCCLRPPSRLNQAWTHLPQPADALLDRGVGREEVCDPLAGERLDNVERRRRGGDLHRDRLGALLEAEQGTRQGFRVAADLRSAGVSRE